MPLRRVALLLLAACALPEGADLAPSPETVAAPPPALVPTARFREALAEAGPAGVRAEAGAAALAARASALRARAAGLAGPVVDPANRARLEGANPGD